jgi:hypothetical protein
MKTFITAMALVFALAIGTSMMALTARTDNAHIDQDSPYKEVHQKNGSPLLNLDCRSWAVSLPALWPRFEIGIRRDPTFGLSVRR